MPAWSALLAVFVVVAFAVALGVRAGCRRSELESDVGCASWALER